MKIRTLILTAVISVVLSYSAFAQTGTLSGFVSDTQQNPISMARVTVLGTAKATVTSTDGSFFMDGIPGGDYDISINHSESNYRVIAAVHIVEDSTTELDIELIPAQYAQITGGNCLPGSQTWIPINISNTTPIGEFNLLLQWPAESFTGVSANPTNRIGSGDFWYSLEDAGPGTARIHWDGATNGPMPGGTEPVFFLHLQADSSLYHEIIPVWFSGSASDNAIFDSSGQALNFDGYRGNPVLIYFDLTYPYGPNANGWAAEIGDVTIVTDFLVIGPIVWAINGTDDDVFQEAAVDLNNNGFADAGDLAQYINLVQGFGTPGNYPILRFLPDIDPGGRDVIVIGNLDGSPIVGHPGLTVEIPIYARTDEFVRGMVVRVMADKSQISEFVGVDTASVLNDWDFEVSNEIDYQPGYGGRTAIMLAGVGDAFYTNGQWSDPIAYFNLRLAESGFIGGENIQLRARANIADSMYAAYQPLLVEGSILVEIENCDYEPGDANGSGEFNGLDVVYSVSYFKGQGSPPPTDCYCGIHGFYGANADSNGDCLLNGLDIVYGVAALKGAGPMPVGCPDCP